MTNNLRDAVLASGDLHMPTHIEERGSKGQLSPDWVEELMGYPRGWTDLDRDEPGIWMGWPARPGEPQYPYEHPRTVVGMKNRAKRLKALGNAVVPQQAEPIFRAIQFIDYMIGEQVTLTPDGQITIPEVNNNARDDLSRA